MVQGEVPYLSTTICRIREFKVLSNSLNDLKWKNKQCWPLTIRVRHCPADFVHKKSGKTKVETSASGGRFCNSYLYVKHGWRIYFLNAGGKQLANHDFRGYRPETVEKKETIIP